MWIVAVENGWELKNGSMSVAGLVLNLVSFNQWSIFPCEISELKSSFRL
jgi:hypothetical protein